ncbi:MAG: outer membrane lipid asymmetry maintenance protein MlaD [Gammaproteobacteria bacterium]
MSIRATEIAVGAFVAVGLVALFLLAMQVSNLASLGNNEGYTITARFENIGGLKVRAPVKSGGVRIGKVRAIHYDPERFEAVVEMHIDAAYEGFPEDTSASIFTAGLLGENYVGLEPGGAEDVLKDGGQIRWTQSALVLEQVIGQFLFSKASESDDK